MVERDSGPLRTDGAVDELTPHMNGQWIVQTQGTLHVFDLDAQKYERRHLDGLNPMRKDLTRVPLPIENVAVWPKVGECFEIFIDVDSYGGYVGSIRTSSRIRSITPATEEDLT